MTNTVHIALVPRDGIFCKDGRGWHTSASGRGHSLDWPWPSTILGALRTAWGRAEEEKTGVLFDTADWRTQTGPIKLGRTLVLRRPLTVGWSAEHTTWPVPLDAYWLEGSTEVQQLEPVKPIVSSLGRDDDEAREFLWRPLRSNATKPLAAPRWWHRQDFASWLAGQSVLAQVSGEELGLARRIQAHVGIMPEELTADEGVLFSHVVIETLDHEGEWAIGLEAVLPNDNLSTVGTLGSDSRLVRLETVPAALFAPPASVIEAFQATSIGLRLVAITPLCFERGWLPDGLESCNGTYRGRLSGVEHELVLRAAFVSRPAHVSGWDIATCKPKPTSRMVAPGAVYFFERTDGEPFAKADARALWLATVGGRTDEGFGRVVPGVWNPTRST